MNELDTTRALLNRQLDEVLTADPLEALSAIGGVQRDVAARRGAAVRVAVQRHTWSEIGAALGVSRQAAHQKFAREWAETLQNELKGEVRAFKAAMRDGDARAAGEAERKRDALIAELKGAGRRWK
ncbi:MAG: hypothetical protein QOE87_3488 [Gaiellales bacterium]|jgi:hypothetical protein|nr:hypothetical protein [Gaiellales bacterium]